MRARSCVRASAAAALDHNAAAARDQ